ncbi:MAG TPA: cyclic nucleotide-binding domain-containing protein, partial [Kofleriaceae bacterium]|nr:cyclic nucleotide-binding domain-containing protein [Kofleriaceae bacterium]
AAERALRAPTFKRRRQALDILQEVARGRDRARLLELLEAYLLPPRDVEPDARQRACDMDPWLARVASSGTEPAMQRLWALRATLLFDDIDGEQLDALAVRANEIELAKGETVVAEGDPGDALFVVMNGVVAVEREGKVVAQLGAGQAFGELALVDGLPRVASVKTEAKSKLLRLPRDTFDAALAEYPEIGLGLVRGLVRWLRQGDDVPRPEAYRR